MEKIEIELKNGNSIEVDISIFEIDEEKGMVNLTKMGKPFGKEIRKWWSLETSKKSVESIAKRNNRVMSPIR